MTHTRVFFIPVLVINQQYITKTRKKKKVSRNRAINKLVPPRHDNRKIPRNDIALLRHACVGEEATILYRKSTTIYSPRGVPHHHLLRTKRTERALLFDGANRGREKRERERGGVTRVLIIFHGLHDRVHAPEVTRAVARVMVSSRNKREGEERSGEKTRNRDENET